MSSSSSRGSCSNSSESSWRTDGEDDYIPRERDDTI